MDPNNPNDNSLPGGDGSDPTGGAGAGTSENASGDAVDVKDVLNELLGKEFQDDQTALESVKETFKTVGEAASFKKAIESYAKAQGIEVGDAVKQLKELTKTAKAKKVLEGSGETPPEGGEAAAPGSETSEVAELKGLVNTLVERDFYRENPQYEPIKGLLSTLQKASGNSLEEVLKMDEIKDVIELAQKSADADSSRSVIHSTSRVGGGPDSDEAKDFEAAQTSGDWANFLMKHRGLDLNKLAEA